MATGVNNNAAVVVVGRTAPVPPGQQTSANSVPVVIASDQTPIPVEEQNKQQSEVALSLLGIPRSEVALGIFADVNTYDVNPTEWSQFPEQFATVDLFQADDATKQIKYENLLGDFDWGLTHIAEEAGAMIEAPADNYSILTSKRFFRYQPGRVSAATFGVKLTRAPYTVTDNLDSGDAIRNPSIKKYGIFDKFDGYYFESRNDGYADNFAAVRRTQSIIRDNPKPFGSVSGAQDQDYAWVGVPQLESVSGSFPVAYEILKANKRYLMEIAATSTQSVDKPKCRRDAGLVIEGVLHDLKYGGNASTIYNTLRFFNTQVPGTQSLYLDSGNVGEKTAQDEIDNYQLILSAMVSILQESDPGINAGVNSSYTPGGTSPDGEPDLGTISYVDHADLGIPAAATLQVGRIESGSVSKVTQLLDGILLTALGKYDVDFNYSSIPDPTLGSAAGEMAILRDGLVMIHAAAFDPSLLKPTVNYSIVSLYNGANTGNKYLKVRVPEGAELLQLGQNVSFESNGGTGTIIGADAEQASDGSIWHISSVLKEYVGTDENLYQFVKISVHPGNEESYNPAIGGGLTTNPWSAGAAYPDIQELDIQNFSDAGGILFQGDTNLDTLNPQMVAAGASLKTPTPFVLPADIRRYQGSQYSNETRPGKDGLAAQYVDGSFPYVYPPGQAAADNSVGYIDSVFNNTSDIKAQINYVNKRLYKNWVWFNVDPKYYKVYEYRVPRSRMSGEKLDGKTTDVIYSDNVLDKQAGAPVLDTASKEQKTFSSVWALDPTKVTMYKIEFSWYGAVGATFLAYVPIENNEARWVRVHHLRASNQLKVASLGNATLPITYLAYGGGNQNAYGYLNADRSFNTESGYGSCSEQLTKYGASYYIDGGDRGTVRLFSYASENLKEIGGSKYVFSSATHPNMLTANSASSQDDIPGVGFVNAPYLEFNGSSTEFFGFGSPSTENRPPISDYYMDARVVTGSPRDQDVRVVYVSGTKVYLSRPLNATSGDVSLIVKRPQPLVGIKCRTEINGVRNRVQIYPTRLATGVTSQSESLAVELIKTPLFQTFDDPVGSSFAISKTQGINIGKRGKKTLLPTGDIQINGGGGGDYLNPGQKLYGWFRYQALTDSSGQSYTTLGLLERGELGKYFFSAYEVSIDELLIQGTFLPAGRWGGPTGDQDGPLNPDLSQVTAPFATSTLARLSAVETDSEQRSPIPGTGTIVTTIFSPNSGEEYELSPYFDYNKDYLSFPLTDIQETLYVCASSKSSYLQDGNYSFRGQILASITWEEQ